MAITVYTYRSCDSCRRAVRWLKEQGIDFVEKPIREEPPTAQELSRALAWAGGDGRRVFNTSGRDYRALALGPQLAAQSQAEKIALLRSNGNLVRRPFLVTASQVIAGFDEVAWRDAVG
jgi:arsenate reductase (glutaredoxin)